MRDSTRSRVPACRLSHPLWLEKTRDTENATRVGSSHNAQRTRSNRYGSLRRGRIPLDRSDSPGRAPRPSPPRAANGRAASRRLARPNARVRWRVFSLRVNNDEQDRSPRRLPRARSPQAPGRSSQSSADVGVLRGRSRTPRDAEYVTSPPRPHRRARPEPARFRCQVERPIPTVRVRDSTVCFPRVRNGFFAKGHFFLGPRVAPGADTSHPRAGRKARSRADRRSSRRGADVRPRRSTRARRPAACARGRPGRRFGTATSARLARSNFFVSSHPSRRSSLRRVLD